MSYGATLAISSAREAVCVREAVLTRKAPCKRKANSVQYQHFRPYPSPNPLWSKARLNAMIKAEAPMRHLYPERPLLQQTQAVSLD